MIGWRRRAKAARDEAVSPERLYELVSQTLMENFGPLGSFAITRRSASDTDDIFHTALARSVAHDIVANLAEHGVVLKPATTPAGATRGVPAVAPVVSIAAVAAGSSMASASPAAAATASTSGRAVIGRAAARSTTPAFPMSAALAPVESVVVPRDLARGISALGARPAVASEPLDDDALRSLVAHHEQVEQAAAAKGSDASKPAPIAI